MSCFIRKNQNAVNTPSATEIAKIGIVIPACNEEACIGAVLEELLRSIDPERFVVLVGVNGSSDRTAEIARCFPVLVAETAQRGYGYGCQAVIDAALRALPDLRAFIFYAGDGASDPTDIATLVAAFESGSNFVLGTRTTDRANWRNMTLSHVCANFALALWCGVLTGQRFTDLAPLRLIERELFRRLSLREMTFGWTIEAQLGAANMGATMREVPARERPRIAGEQKVSGVSWSRTFSVGCRIVAAGWRARSRFPQQALARGRELAPQLVPQPQRGI